VSDTITLRHPTLPATQEIKVPKDALPHYTGAGWQQVPAEELEKRAALKAQAEAEAAAVAEGEIAETADEPEQSGPAEVPTEKPARSRVKAPEKKTEES
jgi:hypothetical protein